jgi:hypothetical protein
MLPIHSEMEGVFGFDSERRASSTPLSEEIMLSVSDEFASD